MNWCQFDAPISSLCSSACSLHFLLKGRTAVFQPNNQSQLILQLQHNRVVIPKKQRIWCVAQSVRKHICRDEGDPNRIIFLSLKILVFIIVFHYWVIPITRENMITVMYLVFLKLCYTYKLSDWIWVQMSLKMSCLHSKTCLFCLASFPHGINMCFQWSDNMWSSETHWHLVLACLSLSHKHP